MRTRSIVVEEVQIEQVRDSRLESLEAKMVQLIGIVIALARQKGPMHPNRGEENSVLDYDVAHQWGRHLGGESTSAEGIYTKALRLKFPTFNGDNLDSRCYRAYQFFDFYDIQDGQQLPITAFHMEGKALSWFQALRNTHNLSSWNEVLVAIQVGFGKGLYDDPMETLSKLKQIGSLEECKTQFELLANRVLKLIDSHNLSC